MARQVGLVEVKARNTFLNGGLTLRPVRQLSIENRYLLTRLRLLAADSAVFNREFPF